MNNNRKKILGISGSPKKTGVSTSYFLLEKALQAAQEEGAETKIARLVDYNVVPCDGCGDCMNKTPCHLFKDPEDNYAGLYKLVEWADAYIFASPVYALGLPFTWKLWLDRCEPAGRGKFDYKYYNYEVAGDVKGRAFQGKIGAQIVTSGGIGQEWALAQLMPLWTNVKLSIVASVGLSMIEFDEQPGIKSKPWGQGVNNADFAIEIARQVGKRVAHTIGFSTFNVLGKSPRVDNLQIKPLSCIERLEAIAGRSAYQLNQKKESLVPKVLVIAGQEKSDEAANRYNYLHSKGIKSDMFFVASVGVLPHFISRDFVRSKILELNHNNNVFIDWDKEIHQELNLSENIEPYVLLLDKDNNVIRTMPGTLMLNEVANEVLHLEGKLI